MCKSAGFALAALAARAERTHPCAASQLTTRPSSFLSRARALLEQIIVDRMQREFNVECKVGAPQVSYREAITKAAEIDYTHKKQSGGTGQFARVKIQFEPLAEGETGFVFESEIKGGAVPKEYIPGVSKGLESVMNNGIVAGFPIIGVKAKLVDGAYHDVDSSVLAFEIAARAAFREGLKKGQARLMEPVMKVEVIVPEEHMGDVIGDINSRRGQVLPAPNHLTRCTRSTALSHSATTLPRCCQASWCDVGWDACRSATSGTEAT